MASITIWYAVVRVYNIINLKWNISLSLFLSWKHIHSLSSLRMTIIMTDLKLWQKVISLLLYDYNNYSNSTHTTMKRMWVQLTSNRWTTSTHIDTPTYQDTLYLHTHTRIHTSNTQIAVCTNDINNYICYLITDF